MGKIKKKSAQNPNAVTKQSIHGIKNNLVQKNKIPKFKGASGSKAALTNNSKMQNKNKSPEKNLQKTTDTKSSQNLLQNNKKELKEQYSLKRKENISNKTNQQGKPANKKMKKEELVDDSWTYDESSNYEEEEVNDNDVPDKKVVKNINSKIEKDDNNDDFDSSSFVTDDEEEEKENDDVPNIHGKILSDLSKKGNKDFEGAKDEDNEDKNDDNDNKEEYGYYYYYDKFREFREYCLDKNDKEMEVLVDTVKGILEKVCEEKYILPYPDAYGNINRTSIRIENLSKDITQFDIKKKFEEFGSIKSIKFILFIPSCYNKIMRCQAKHPNHPFVASVSALVNYYCPLSAKKAFSMNGKIFEGNYITVCYKNNFNCLPIDSARNVTLSNMPWDVDVNSIWKIFGKCGEIKNVYVYRNQHTGINERVGTIYFMTKDAARKAVELSGTLILNCQVKVEAGYPADIDVRIKRERADVFYNLLMRKGALRNIVNDINWEEKAQQNLQLKSNDNNASKSLRIMKAVARKAESEEQ